MCKIPSQTDAFQYLQLLRGVLKKLPLLLVPLLLRCELGGLVPRLVLALAPGHLSHHKRLHLRRVDYCLVSQHLIVLQQLRAVNTVPGSSVLRGGAERSFFVGRGGGVTCKAKYGRSSKHKRLRRCETRGASRGSEERSIGCARTDIVAPKCERPSYESNINVNTPAVPRYKGGIHSRFACLTLLKQSTEHPCSHRRSDCRWPTAPSLSAKGGQTTHFLSYRPQPPPGQATSIS